jgi:hypothetical protein
MTVLSGTRDPAVEIHKDKIGVALYFNHAAELAKLTGDNSLLPSYAARKENRMVPGLGKLLFNPV